MLPDKRRVLWTLLGFAVVFVVLNWPSRSLGRLVTAGASELATAAFGGTALGTDLVLRFAPAERVARTPDPSVDAAWTLVLRADRPSIGAHAHVPLNLRRIFWVPISVLIALSIAAPIWRRRRGLVALALGLVALQVPIAVSVVLLAEGLLFEAYVLDLSDTAQTVLRFGYALLAPPGIVYALPLLLWALIMLATTPRTSSGAVPASH